MTDTTRTLEELVASINAKNKDEQRFGLKIELITPQGRVYSYDRLILVDNAQTPSLLQFYFDDAKNVIDNLVERLVNNELTD